LVIRPSFNLLDSLLQETDEVPEGMKSFKNIFMKLLSFFHHNPGRKTKTFIIIGKALKSRKYESSRK
jgi:hypothetical protein